MTEESGLALWSNQSLSSRAVFPTSLLWQQNAAAGASPPPVPLTPGLHSHCIQTRLSDWGRRKQTRKGPVEPEGIAGDS